MGKIITLYAEGDRYYHLGEFVNGCGHEISRIEESTINGEMALVPVYHIYTVNRISGKESLWKQIPGRYCTIEYEVE